MHICFYCTDKTFKESLKNLKTNRNNEKYIQPQTTNHIVYHNSKSKIQRLQDPLINYKPPITIHTNNTLKKIINSSSRMNRRSEKATQQQLYTRLVMLVPLAPRILSRSRDAYVSICSPAARKRCCHCGGGDVGSLGALNLPRTRYTPPRVFRY